jgi:outer membrane protein OmpA-like peptidoglycan-associated protein
MTKPIKLLILAAVLILVSGLVSANPNDVRVYEGNVGTVSWVASPSDKLVCKLTQNIPFFGQIELVHFAGKTPTFVLHAQRGPFAAGKAELLSRPPDWFPGPATKPIAVVTTYPGSTPLVFDPIQTRMMLAELERGWTPTISFQDWDGTSDQVFVSILPVNFREGIINYYFCEQAMLPFGFDEVKHTIIYFGPNGVSLDGKARLALRRIAEYVKVDPSISGVKLSGYSDSQEDKKTSYELSIQRLKTVQTFLFGQDIPYEDIDATAYGERDPMGDNNSPYGRAQNRRVVVELLKE